MQYKLVPTSLLIKNAAWLLLANLLNVVRQTVAGRLDVLFAVYRDAFKQMPAMRQERAQIKIAARISPVTLAKVISRRFYRQGYAKLVFAETRARLK